MKSVGCFTSHMTSQSLTSVDGATNVARLISSSSAVEMGVSIVIGRTRRLLRQCGDECTWINVSLGPSVLLFARTR